MARSIPDHAIRVVKDSPNLRELTTQALRNAILGMHFKPKEKLVERRLCEQTGVSRTCVREALQHLESEGLVERVPNRGLFVATVSRDEARQIYEVRAALEAAAGRRFVERANGKQLKALEAAYARVAETAIKEPVIAYVKALDKFCDVLLEGAGNEVARRVLRTLRARMSYLRALTAQKSHQARHVQTLTKMRAIVDAATDRDARAMAARCRDFVHRSAKFADKVLNDQE
jgi:DNA-binding GntR family transcriptional regulator